MNQKITEHLESQVTQWYVRLSQIRNFYSQLKILTLPQILELQFSKTVSK